MITQDQKNILNLSGRQAYYSQGYEGEGQFVYHCDSGVNVNHPELIGKVIGGYNFIDKNEDITPNTPHGTHTLAIVIGETVGVARKSEAFVAKCIAKEGWTPQPVIDAIYHCIDYRHPTTGKKATSFNFSASTHVNYSSLRRAIQKLKEAGIAFICTSGNTKQEEIRYPGSYPETICVGAVDWYKNHCLFSTTSKYVDVVQVGKNIPSAASNGDGIYYLTGTSQAAPIVSGISLLVAEKWETEQVEAIPVDMLITLLTKVHVKDLGPVGKDKLFGYGFCTLQPMNLEMELIPDSDYMVLNNLVKPIEVESQIVEGHFILGFRDTLSPLGGHLWWNAETRRGILSL